MSDVHRTILVVAAHPDDEVLGCGGTLAKLAEQGAAVNVSFLSDRVTARPAEPAEHQRQPEARRSAPRQAAAILGVKHVTFGALLLCFEVASSTERQLPGSAAAFTPNWYEDINATLEHKLAALDVYAAEMRGWPNARSREAVEHLARWRGATVGARAAEAFVLGRKIA